MHLKSLHTIWLTLFTTLVLLVSSVANSEPLMNIQMMSTGMAHHPSMMSDSEHCGMPGMMDVSMTDASMSEDGDARETSMNCGGGSGMVHTCCTAACTIVFVPYRILSIAQCPSSIAQPLLLKLLPQSYTSAATCTDLL